MSYQRPVADRVAGIILAAGASTRFGSPKQLARVGERTMLEAVIEIARAAGLEPILAVVPPGVAVPADVVPVINGAPEAGLSQSLQLGIHAVADDISAVVLLLGDQPTLESNVVRSLLDARGTRPIVAVAADGVLAPPVLVERSQFGLVDELRGDIGLRQLLRERPEAVRRVEVAAHAADIDTPADLAAIDP